MSGGSAGKVYFVLYLAVVLELLIIIVERDEAEEHLHRKQKEAMQLVQSILSQLQAGSGSEGINTRPQDEITMRPDGMDAATIKEILGAEIKSYRKYIIEVGVTDVSSELLELVKKVSSSSKEIEEKDKQRLDKFVSLSNVQDMEFQIFFTRSANQRDVPTIAPEFFTEKELKDRKINTDQLSAGQVETTEAGVAWEFLGSQKLELNNDATLAELLKNIKNKGNTRIKPVYKTPEIKGDMLSFVPEEIKSGNRADSLFFYVHSDKDEKATEDLVKKSFEVNFQPKKGQGGWYKLRFMSKTSRILGIKGGTEKISDDAVINVGTVELKAKDLAKVKNDMKSEISKFVNVTELENILLSFKDEKSNKKELSDKFNSMINEGIAKAKKEQIERKSGDEDLSVKVRLYGYMARLLTPGASRYFDQNSNSIDFDVRVVIPEPKQVAPQIMVNSYLHTFDEATPTFMFSISPYQEGRNNIKGFVYNKGDETGAPVAEVTFQPTSPNAPKEGEARSYIAKLNKKLLGGNGVARQYTVKLSHELSGKRGDTTATLNVYPTVSEDEVTKLERQFGAFATYGTDFFFNFTPPSGRNIAPDQFAYYFKTDGDQQDRGASPGLKAERSDKLTFPSNAKEATLKIVWINPITKEEVAVFPEKTVKIKQTAPSISTNFTNESIAGDEVLSCRITNIKLSAPTIGNGKNAKVDFSVEVEQVQVKQNYRIVGKPTFNQDGEVVTVDFKIQGEPNEDGWAKGNVTLKFTAIATNPENGVKSDPVKKTFTFKVNKKIEAENDYFGN